MIEVKIRKRLAEFELDVDVSLPASTVAVFGPSGSGKSTLLNAIAGLLRPDAGRIAIRQEVLFDDGEKINLPPEARRLGLVPQDGLLLPHRTVKQNLLYGYRRVRGRPRRVELDEVAEVLEIGHLLGRYPGNLSGGERQRVALGRALLASPHLLLFDEPLASIDATLKGKILSYLQRAIAHFGIPALYISHDRSEVTRLADTIVVLRQGKVIACGRYNDIIDSPGVYRAFTREGIDNVLEATILANKQDEGYSEVQVRSTVFKVPLMEAPAGSIIILNIKAGDIILARDRPARISTRNVLPGSVKRLADVGDLLLAHIDVGCELIVELTPEAVRELEIGEGARIWALIKTNAFTFDLFGNELS